MSKLSYPRTFVARRDALPPLPGPDRGGAPVSAPSPRQKLILEGLARGDNYQDIALLLGMNPRTLRNYTSHLYSVIGVADRAAWVRIAYRRGWLTVEPGPSPTEPLTTALDLMLRGFAIGRSDVQMAKALGCSPRTVSEHGARLRRRLGAAHRAHSVALGYQLRHLHPSEEIEFPPRRKELA